MFAPHHVPRADCTAGRPAPGCPTPKGRRRRRGRSAARAACLLAMLLASSPPLAGFRMLPNGCSWYETHHLGGCQRLATPRTECSGWETPTRPLLAVVVPVRGANAALLCSRLTAHLHRFRVRHHIVVVNQVDALPFNRGALANAAVLTLLSEGRSGRHNRLDFDYIAVQDVDRFPVLDNTSCDRVTSEYYAFPSGAPRALHPTSFAGGVLLIRTALYRAVNGFSNDYWGYGEEDNDLFLRLRWCGTPPQHGAALESCMEHRDCEACKREKKELPAGLLGSQLERARARMRRPRYHMLRDGLSTVNFTIERHERRKQCTPEVSAEFLHVRLRSQSRKEQGSKLDHELTDAAPEARLRRRRPK
jgi:xylosylprotein 4-beta-galactosyltransferase